MKIIHKYTLREFLESFFFGLCVFSSILLLDQIFQLINLVLGKNVSFFTVFKLFLLVLPNVLSLTIPMAMLFGILLSFGRLSEDNEITALRSTGFNYFEFTVPILTVALVLSLFLVYFNQEIAPATHRNFRTIYKEILTQRPLVKFEEKSISKFGDYRIFIENSDNKNNILNGVLIYKSATGTDDANNNWRICAASATVFLAAEGIVFDLSNGYWQKPNPLNPGKLVHLVFNNFRFKVPLLDSAATVNQSLKEIKGSEITQEIETYKKGNLPTRFLETEYWLRYTLAFSTLILALVGLPLGIVIEKGAKTISFGLSLILLFGYYLLLVTSLNIAEKGQLSPGLILWLPNIAGIILSVFLWKRMYSK